MKILETERLVLRDLRMEDAEHIFKTWTSDEETTRYMIWNTHKAVSETEEWLKFEITKREGKGYYSWGIELKETGKLIGSMGAYYRDDDGRYEIGYIIAKPYWNKGYTTEAAKAMLNYLIKEENIKCFRSEHAKLNPASGRVMEKLGMKHLKDTIYERYDKSETFESKVYYLDIDKIILEKPEKRHEKQAIEYRNEHYENGEKVINGCGRWDKVEIYDEWLKSLELNSNKETVQPNHAPSTTFFGIRESDKKIVGMIDIRHELSTEFLRNYAGHIGYGVRPTERRKGYVTQMLKLALEFSKNELGLDEVMLSCDKENEGSRKTIVNAGGKLEREYIANNGENVQLYWIKL